MSVDFTSFQDARRSTQASLQKAGDLFKKSVGLIITADSIDNAHEKIKKYWTENNTNPKTEEEKEEEKTVKKDEKKQKLQNLEKENQSLQDQMKTLQENNERLQSQLEQLEKKKGSSVLERFVPLKKENQLSAKNMRSKMEEVYDEDDSKEFFEE